MPDPDARGDAVPDGVAGPARTLAEALAEALAEVALPTVEGATLRLGDLRGRRVLLFCWASW
jgi:hypothetical protein